MKPQGINFITKQAAPEHSAKAMYFPSGSDEAVPMPTSFSYGELTQVNDYRTKGDQIKANFGWVFAANDLIAESFSAVEIKLYKKTKTGRDEIEEHPILTLFDEPTDTHDELSFRYLIASYFNLNGEAYVVPYGKQQDGLPASLHIIPAHQVDYRVNAATGDEIIKWGKNSLTNTADEKKFWRMYKPDPANPIMGKSIVGASAGAVDTDNKSQRYNRQFYANAARPSLLVTNPKAMTPEAYKRFKEQLTELHTGVNNAYKPIILEGGASAQPFSLNQKEMDFLNSRKFTMEEILAMFKVSPAMLGMIQNANRANMDASEYNFAKYVLLPLLRKFVSFINRYMIKPYDETLELGFVNPVPDDVATKATVNKQAINSWKTINEVRADEDLPPIEGGDTMFVPSGLTTLERAADPAANTPEQLKPFAGVEDNPDNKPPKDENDDSKEPNAADAAAEKAYRRRLAADIKAGRIVLAKKKLKDPVAERAIKGERRIKAMQPILDSYEIEFMRACRSLFDLQRTAVLTELAQQLPTPTKAFKPRTKAAGNLQDQLALLVANVQYDIDLSESMQPIYKALMDAQIADAIRQLPSPYTPPKEVPGVEEFIKERSGMVAKDINAETQKQLLASLAEGIANGDDRAALTARVEAVFGDAAGYRAERIARTESVKAAGKADVYGWSDSEIVKGKQWYTGAADACPYCRSLNGRVVELEQNFYNLGDTQKVDYVNAQGEQKSISRVIKYEAMATPPAHVSCRCTLLPVLSI